MCVRKTWCYRKLLHFERWTIGCRKTVCMCEEADVIEKYYILNFLILENSMYVWGGWCDRKLLHFELFDLEKQYVCVRRLMWSKIITFWTFWSWKTVCMCEEADVIENYYIVTFLILENSMYVRGGWCDGLQMWVGWGWPRQRTIPANPRKIQNSNKPHKLNFSWGRKFMMQSYMQHPG